MMLAVAALYCALGQPALLPPPRPFPPATMPGYRQPRRNLTPWCVWSEADRCIGVALHPKSPKVYLVLRGAF